MQDSRFQWFMIKNDSGDSIMAFICYSGIISVYQQILHGKNEMIQNEELPSQAWTTEPSAAYP